MPTPPTPFLWEDSGIENRFQNLGYKILGRGSYLLNILGVKFNILIYIISVLPNFDLNFFSSIFSYSILRSFYIK